MKQMYKKFPLISPWILFFLFLQPLFFKIEFKVPMMEKQPLEILMESDRIDTVEEDKWKFSKGILFKSTALQDFLSQIEAVEIPSDGFPEETYERLNRILFGQELIVLSLAFLALLCITSYISWITQAWFRITLNKILHWLGFIWCFFSVGSPLPFVNESGFALFLFLFFLSAFVFLIFSYQGLNAGKKESTRFEVLKHTAELDEEGKKPTGKVSMNPFRVSYHFAIIVLVGLLVGNFVYIPLFMLQKHFANEFGILMVFLIVLLCGFYIRNYTKISEDPTLPKWGNLMASLSYLQYKFIRNFALGIGATLLVVVFITVLFSILLMNSDVLKNPGLGIMESSTEF